MDALSDEKGWPFYLEHLTHLLSHRALDELLADALAYLTHLFRARGGSLLYGAALTERARQGALSEAARKQIDHLEAPIYARRWHSVRQMQLPAAPPVSTYALPDESGNLYVVPLTNHDRVCGLLSLALAPRTDLSYQEIQLLSRLVGTLSAIVANVEQICVTRQRLSQLGLFYQMGQAMTSTFETDRLFRDTIDLAMTVIDAQQARLLLLDPRGEWLEIEMARGAGRGLEARRVPVGAGVTGWVAACAEPALINDPAVDDRYDASVDGLADRAVHNLACAPLQIKGKVIGVLEVMNKGIPSGFDEEDLSVLITLAAQVSIALENARLYNTLRDERDRIIAAQESTRHELARNLHDGPVQLLATVAMEIDYLERLIDARPQEVPAQFAALRRLLRQAMQEARLLLFELRPVILETQGLVPALESYVERLRESSAFAPHFDPGNVQTALSGPVAGIVFSIIQEAMNNIEKHAHARNVWLRMVEEQDELVVSIEDDGTGFDVAAVIDNYDQGSSFGLLNMRERAQLIDGALTVESGPSRGRAGTLVQLRLALSRDRGCDEREPDNHD
ncbi:MAG: GAF domain-containing sensor histidine kinase [Anaerolineae bacterium]|nr:GAF domain-containing sensor histidine kinase [Anaerolineae bacterium]